jgi:hypothetical protein
MDSSGVEKSSLRYGSGIASYGPVASSDPSSSSMCLNGGRG